MNPNWLGSCPDTVNTQQYGEFVPRISGSISVVSSALIIYIISISPTKLSSATYRIMLGLSVCDIIGSTAMALSHLPMPAEDINYHIDSYCFQGLRLGNYQTCTAQGALVTFGIISTCCYNTTLCVYYACMISFGLSERTMRLVVEPMLHIFPILIACLGSMFPIFFDMYNPTPWESWCSVDPVPYACYSGCQRGNLDFKDMCRILPVVLITSNFVLIVSSLACVYWKVSKVQRNMNYLRRRFQRQNNNNNLHQQNLSQSRSTRRGRNYSQRRRRREQANDQAGEAIPAATATSGTATQEVAPPAPAPTTTTTNTNNGSRNTNNGSRIRMLNHRHHTSKMVLAQSLSYICAQVLTLLFPLLIILGYDLHSMRLIFQPLQGFYNFVIFVVFKIYHIRTGGVGRGDQTSNDTIISLRQALGEIFLYQPLPRRQQQQPGRGDHLMTTVGITVVDESQDQDVLPPGFQTGLEFISFDEYVQHHETTMDGLSLEPPDDDDDDDDDNDDDDGDYKDDTNRCSSRIDGEDDDNNEDIFSVNTVDN